MKKFILFIHLFIATGFLSFSSAQKKEKANQYSSAVLTDWLNFHCNLVRTVKGVPHVGYSRDFAYTAIAAYESFVASNPSSRSLSGQLIDLKNLPATPKEKIYWPASVNAAYAYMLRQFYSSFGNNKTRIDSMETAAQQAFKNAGVQKKLVEKANAYGRSVAAAIIEWSQTDGFNSSKEFVLEKGEGLWAPTPPSFTPANVPYWSEKRSFTSNLFSVFALTKPVYSSNSEEAFYKMAKEVYDVSQNLTPEQKATALYWDDSPNGNYKTVFGHWTSILSGLIQSHNLSLPEATQAFAAMAISMHEASLLAWKGKYEYKVVRPITFIQQHIDKNWMPLIATPPHPEFPAAHATLSNSAATALCAFFGETCAVTDNAYTDLGMSERKFISLQEAAKEGGYSRLYGGIHYRYSIEQGFVLGAAAANHVLKQIQFKRSSDKPVSIRR